jgi:hypothetical protein
MAKCEDCNKECRECESGLCPTCKDETDTANRDRDFEQGEHHKDKLAFDSDKKKSNDRASRIGWSVLKGEDEQEHLMAQMPRPHSNKVDCANCHNYPMKKVARKATGGVEPYYECPLCGNSVRVIF